MIKLVWAVLAAALPTFGGRYVGRHRMSWALQWDSIHARLPWQRGRRRIAALRRTWQRPTRHSHARSHARGRAPVRVRPEDLSWAWWIERRELYKSALTAAGAW